MSLTDKINALTAYANEVTGESDTTLSEAVHTLADGYGQGGGDSIWNKIVDRTVTEVNDTDGLCKVVGDYAFYYCESLVSAIFPSATIVGSYAFGACSNLASVDLPSATSVGNNAFYSCSNLSYVDIPSATIVGSYAFYSCSNLASVDLPSATNVKSYAFGACSNLASVDLPSATNLGPYSFTDCRALKTLILRRSGSICTISNISVLYSTPIKSGTGYIYVPASLLETYKTNSKWSTVAAQFRALEDYTVDGTITGDLDPNKI